MSKVTSLFRIGSFAIMTLTVFACTSQVETYQGPERNKDLYGPQAKVYELPEVKGKIYFVSPEGNPDIDGLSKETPTTIESAISRVVTGDAIVMRGGIYRTGNLQFNQGITIQPFRDEKPMLNGTL